MNPFAQRLQNQINNKHTSNNFERISFLFVKEFNWSYKELMKTPIPFILIILKEWNEYKKEEEKQYKKK